MNDSREIDQLLREAQTISEAYNIVAETTGERFNIFSILNVETDEVKTHSGFIAELLDEKGSHGQGTIFMEKFNECIPIEDFDIENGYDVIVERYAGKVTEDKDGRIDIFIKNKRSDYILIENKIYAQEQNKQLLRYQNSFPNSTILYLTLRGEESKQTSSDKVNYTPISYQTDIINWLEMCQKEAVAIPILRETITQYINLIKKLTGQNLNKKMSNEIIERILRNEESMEAYRGLFNSRKDLEERIRRSFCQRLPKIAEQHKLELEIKGKEEIVSGIGRNLPAFKFHNEKLKALNLKFIFRFQEPKLRKPIIGLQYIEKPANQLPQYDEIRERFDIEFGNSDKTSTNFLCYLDYQPNVGWEALRTLKRIHFGEFEEDLNSKIKKVLKIIKEATNPDL